MRLNQDCCRRLVTLLVLLALITFSGLAEAASWRFAVLGDQRDSNGSWGVNRFVVQSMVNDIENRGISLALVGGDQIYGVHGTPPVPGQASLPTMYQHWRAAMGALLPICYPVRGNHETAGEIYNPNPHYWNACVVRFLPQIPRNGPSGEKGMTYSFANKGAFFVGLDNFIPGNENRVNQTWLDQQLAANILPHLFVYAHEPAVALDPLLPNLADYPLQRDAFWKSLSQAGARVYLCGHHHLYNRATVTITDIYGQRTKPITQLVVGGGGAPFEPWSGQYYPYLEGGGQPQPPAPERVTTTLQKHQENRYGYSIVTVDGNQVSITYYAGQNLERGVPTSWYPFETFDYTVTSKTLGLNDVNQAINPQILTDFYPGIAINKIGAGVLTLNTGTSTYSEPITVSGGQMRVYGAFAAAPVFVKYGGQVTLQGGSLHDVTVVAGGNLVGPGTVGNLTNNGHVCPDLVSGPWNLQVNGDLTQTAAGNIKVELGSAANYGKIQVTGAAALDGVLFVSVQDTCTPAAGQIFPNIITAGRGLTGTFSQIIPYPPNYTFQANYTGNSVSLQVVSVSN